jgi:hypothetical protein
MAVPLPSTADANPHRAREAVLGQPELLLHVLEHADGTTLARAGAVSVAWRRAACRDGLWRERVFAERSDFVATQPRPMAPPAWAIEQPRTAACTEPRRSWRQAYRLLAVLEHGRPTCEEGAPHLSLNAGSVPPSSPTRSRAGVHDIACSRPTAWLHADAAGAGLEAALGRPAGGPGSLRSGLVGAWRRVSQLGDVAAVQDVRGHVMLLWRDADRAHRWLLPLRQRGLLAAEVVLYAAPHRADAIDAAAPAHSGLRTVGLMTRSGLRWLRWRLADSAPAVAFAGRHGRPIHVSDRACWLGWGRYSHADAYHAFALHDLATGERLLGGRERPPVVGANLLTEYGPLLGWRRDLGFARIQWTTQPDRAHLPQNASTHVVHNNRPVAISGEHAAAQLGVAQVRTMRLDEDVPGLLCLELEIRGTQGAISLLPAHIEDWSACLRPLTFAPALGLGSPAATQDSSDA